MPQTLCLSKSTISLWSLQISQKIEFTLSPPFIKTWKKVFILLIIMSNPEGSCVEYERLQNENHKNKKIKGKGKQHPYYNFSPNKLKQTPLPELFPNLFYKQWLLPLNLLLFHSPLILLQIFLLTLPFLIPIKIILLQTLSNPSNSESQCFHEPPGQLTDLLQFD